MTPIVQAELQVRQFEEHFRAAFQATPDAVAINRLSDGAYVEVNEGFTLATGYTREQAIGKSSLELGIWANPKQRAELVQHLLQDGIVQNFEGLFRKKTGQTNSGIMSARIVTLNGEPHILSVTRDLTAWKLAEQALIDRENSLEKALQFSHTLLAAIEQAGEEITITDLDGNIQYCNPSFERITGYSRAEVVGKNPRLLKSGLQDSEFYRQMWATIKAGRTWKGRFTNRRRDGSLVVEDATISSIFSPSGKPLGFVAVKRDVTEQLQLEARFYQAQKLESIGRLAGGVAHDFNNLLTIISGYSGMQFERTGLSDPTHREAEQIRGAAERAATLTRQLLAFSRQQVLQPRRVNLNDIVRSIDKMLRRLIGEDIEVRTLLAPNLGTVKVDPGQVDQVLMNLVVNARDAMPEGGKLTIQTENAELGEEYVSAHEYVDSGRYVLLAVSDNGTGMSPETKARIFEPFFTTKEPGKGTGLGMPMVYGIVKQSCGHIEVYSEPNCGTTVKVYLPRVDETVEEVQSVVERSEPVGGSERLLLVEDDAQLRQLVTEVLSARGYTVQVIEKIDELDAVLQGAATFDLLLTDVVMPNMSGPDLAKRVAQRWPRIKILYTSGYTTDAIVHHGILDQGVFFLQKPFTPSSLAAKVREVLGSPSRPETQP